MRMKMPLLLGMILLFSWMISCKQSTHSGVVERGLENYAEAARNLKTKNGEDDGSLWSDRAGYSDGFRDVKARRVADLITIQVVESTSAVSEASTETLRETSVEAQLPNLFGLENKMSELPTLLDTSGSSEYAGDAATTRRSVLQTSVTAQVVEVFPNGNLLLEGDRELLVNGERQIVTVRGVARPNDISPQNVILSTRIAEMEFEIKGKGIVSKAQEPGLLYRLLAGIWPL
jgi:flagellar L-ring protein precursor FlgH